jgi:hypothetical protein
MNQEAASKLSVADIKAFGPATDSRDLEALLGRLADLARESGNMLLWGWLCLVSEMPDDIAEVTEIPRLEAVRDAMRESPTDWGAPETIAILDAAISVLRRP